MKIFLSKFFPSRKNALKELKEQVEKNRRLLSKMSIAQQSSHHLLKHIQNVLNHPSKLLTLEPEVATHLLKNNLYERINVHIFQYLDGAEELQQQKIFTLKKIPRKRNKSNERKKT